MWLCSLTIVGASNSLHCEETPTYSQKAKVTIQLAHSLEEVRKIKNPKTEFKEWFIDAVNNKCVWIAYHDDQVAGIVALRVYNKFWPETFANGKDRMELLDLYVLPSMRRHGIGRALCKAVEKEATQRGATWLTLHSFNHAIGFYKKLGYQEFCRKNHFQKNLRIDAPNASNSNEWTGKCY